MVITVKVTPRTIERMVFILVILVFVSATAYYSYVCGNCYSCAGNSTGNATADSEGTKDASEAAAGAKDAESEPASEAASAEEGSTDTSSGDTAADTDTSADTSTDSASTGPTSYKDVEITVSPLKYTIKESSTYKKAVVSSITFNVKNKMATDIKSMKAKVYFWDSSSHESWQTSPKDTLNFPTIKAGTSLTQTLSVKNMNMYNFDLVKTVKFEFVDAEDKEIATITKTLEITE